MNTHSHIPAYNRARSSFGSIYIKRTIEYRPSIIRDLGSAINEITSKYSPPYTPEKLIEIFGVTIFFPFLLTYLFFYAAYCAELEKLTWDFEHSKEYFDKRKNEESFSYPNYRFRPILIGIFWSGISLMLIVSVLVGLRALYEKFISIF